MAGYEAEKLFYGRYAFEEFDLPWLSEQSYEQHSDMIEAKSIANRNGKRLKMYGFTSMEEVIAAGRERAAEILDAHRSLLETLISHLEAAHIMTGKELTRLADNHASHMRPEYQVAEAAP